MAASTVQIPATYKKMIFINEYEPVKLIFKSTYVYCHQYIQGGIESICLCHPDWIANVGSRPLFVGCHSTEGLDTYQLQIVTAQLGNPAHCFIRICRKGSPPTLALSCLIQIRAVNFKEKPEQMIKLLQGEVPTSVGEYLGTIAHPMLIKFYTETGTYIPCANLHYEEIWQLGKDQD